MTERVLNLLVIDEEQLYAEKLVSLLSYYYDEVNLGFWDEKAELVKALRNEWDVLVFNRAYDMSFTDVIGVLQEEAVSLPLIYLVQDDEIPAVNEAGLPETLEGDIVKTLSVGQDNEIVIAICLLASYSVAKRQIVRLRQILTESEQRASILIANSNSAVAYIDQGVHVFANQPYLQMFGYDSVEDIIGVPVVDIISGGDNVKAFKQFLRKFDKGNRSDVEFEFKSRRTDGETFASSLQLASATFEGEPVVQMIIQHNDNDAAELAQKLAAAERQDPLTGLPNRLGFTEQLNKTQQDISSSGGQAALVYISMDNVGKINSSAGLSGVDASIKYIANLLNEVFAEGVVARFSDSTFAAILDDTKKEKAVELAQKACTRAESSLIEVGNRTVTTTLSVGVVMIDSNAPNTDTLLARAFDTLSDIAEETDNQGNKVGVFDISKHADADEDVLIEYIQTALTHNRFNLKYQPIYDVNTDTSDLFEVYITLPMADGSEMTFDKLSQVAKKHGLLDKIDRWQLINASKQLAQVKKTHPNAQLLIGLSVATLADGNLTKMVLQLVKAVGAQGAYPIMLQFSEQDVVDYLAVAKRQFMALKEIGCAAGVRGFGAAAKSIEIIEYLSPDFARLAKSYAKNLDGEDNVEAVQGLVSAAKEKGVDVLMPYIQDGQAMSTAWSVGVRYLQGDYLQPATKEMVYAEQTQ